MKWVGLVQVIQNDGVYHVLGENRGAHATVLAWCEDEADFDVVVANALTKDGLQLVDTEDVETCEERLHEFETDRKFRDAVAKLSESNPVVYMDFHTFPIQSH